MNNEDNNPILGFRSFEMIHRYDHKIFSQKLDFSIICTLNTSILHLSVQALLNILLYKNHTMVKPSQIGYKVPLEHTATLRCCMSALQLQLLDQKIGEPGLLLQYHGSGILFDAPFILFDRNIKTSTLHGLTHLLLTHRHRDHYGGIDRLFFEVSPFPFVMGNPGTLHSVQTRLHSYDINLIEPDTIHGQDVSIHDERVIIDHKGFQIEAIALTHGNISSIAFAFQENSMCKRDKEKLKRSPYSSGAWVRQAKHAIEAGTNPSHINIEGISIPFSAIAPLFFIQKGTRVVYASDFDMSTNNIQKLISFTKEADHFYCEAAYLNEDVQLAKQNHHQTVGSAAQIALDAQVHTLHLFHHSRRYQRQESSQALFLQQAQAIFPNTK